MNWNYPDGCSSNDIDSLFESHEETIYWESVCEECGEDCGENPRECNHPAMSWQEILNEREAERYDYL